MSEPRTVGGSGEDLDVTEIHTAITTATTLIAVVVSLFLLRQGQADRRELRRDAEREQASKVTSWADWHEPEFATFARPQVPAIFVRNSSEAAVYDAFVDYRDPASGSPVRQPMGPVPPGERRLLEIDYDGEVADNWEPAALFARLYFQDSAGRRWMRDGLGRLRADPGQADDDPVSRSAHA